MTKFPCYLFDVDGTIADCTHRLHHINQKPKNWDGFFADSVKDIPIKHMRTLANTLSDGGGVIVYVSGRPQRCRSDTIAWLEENGFPAGDIYMRKDGDYRDDSIVKAELLDQLLEDRWNPIMSFDDRNRVVKMWRERGIPCAQVAEGDF